MCHVELFKTSPSPNSLLSYNNTDLKHMLTWIFSKMGTWGERQMGNVKLLETKTKDEALRYAG